MDAAPIKSFVIFISLVVLTASCLSASASQFLIVQSLHVKPYDEAAKGIMATVPAGADVYFTTDTQKTDLIREIREKRPDAIIVIGADALAKLSRIKDVPIIYCMVLAPEKAISDSTNITGINIVVSPDRQLASFQKIMPQAKKVGVVFDRRKNQNFVKKATAVSTGLGIDLVVKDIDNSRDVPTSLNELRGKIQALWLIPDTTVINKATLDFILLFSLENRVPIFTFSSHHIEMGAFMSIDLDPFQAGRQAGELAKSIAGGKKIGESPPADAKNGIVTVNLKIARKLGVEIDEGTLSNAKLIR